jgi:hypothetical protein
VLAEISKFVDTWRTLSANDINVLNTVGITNKTYVVEHSKGSESTYIPQSLKFTLKESSSVITVRHVKASIWTENVN